MRPSKAEALDALERRLNAALEALGPVTLSDSHDRGVPFDTYMLMMDVRRMLQHALATVHHKHRKEAP